jgi:hypothetical protein
LELVARIAIGSAWVESARNRSACDLGVRALQDREAEPKPKLAIKQRFDKIG